MFGSIRSESYYVDRWKEGFFTGTESAEVELKSIKRVKDSKYWFSAIRHNKKYILQMFKRINGVNYLYQRTIFTKALPEIVELKEIENPEMNICKCGCTTFEKIPKTKPCHDDYKCVDCGQVQTVSDLYKSKTNVKSD